MADKYEKFWTRHHSFLHEHGYELRDKFKPGWVPTWESESQRARDPDGPGTPKPSCIVDATKSSDRKPVMLKKVLITENPHEVDICLYLSSLQHHSENHAVPILEVFTSPQFDYIQLVVMPRLRLFDDPSFDTVGEVVDAFRQIFEGIEFLHNHFIAHRDIHWGNIMLDPTRLYPNGSHPADTDRSPNFKSSAKYITRTECWPRYYLIDFGLSRRYSPDGLPFEVTQPNADSENITLLPEHSGAIPRRYNPFPVDIFRLGHMLTWHFEVDEFHPLQFLLPLAQKMLAKEPSSRPTITDVRRLFAEVCLGLTKEQLRSPGDPFSDNIFQRFRQFRHIVTCTRPLPRHTSFQSDRTALDDTLRPFYTCVASDLDASVTQ
ncbi:hypothetical protein BDZ89DRAFT_1014081 [Hymenopellis radicata]|nr:hypothetical protein BDZ89DRAFT_1014081 [Hymenopellis radicata]